MGETSISWTHMPGRVGKTWNAVQGCEKVSPGCAHCYAERLAGRFCEDGWSKGLIRIGKKGQRTWNGKARLAAHKLTEPLKWRQPATIFTNSMSDLFFEEFTNEEIAAVFGVMAAARQHIFQCLTKRAARMRAWFRWIADQRSRVLPWDNRASICWDYACQFIRETGASIDHSTWNADFAQRAHTIPWPLPNVWLGTSVEADNYKHRIPDLLHSDAVVRFLSLEPLLGPIDLTHVGTYANGEAMSCLEEQVGFVERPAIDQVIAGCESGPGSRHCEVDWIRSLRDQCAAQRVPFFFKQGVESAAVQAGEGSKRKGRGVIELPYLDGKQWNQFPRIATAEAA